MSEFRTAGFALVIAVLIAQLALTGLAPEKGAPGPGKQPGGAQSWPSARNGFALAYDSGNDRIVLFGGSNREWERLADTWIWDGSAGASSTSRDRRPASTPRSLSTANAEGRCYSPDQERMAGWEIHGSSTASAGCPL